MAYLLDTNVISEPKKKAPDAQALRWLAQHTLETAFISALSLGEIEQGITLLGNTAHSRLKCNDPDVQRRLPPEESGSQAILGSPRMNA